MEPHKIINNQYRLERVIKRGGFGTIYYGWDQGLQRPVAVKEILPHLLAEPRYAAMLADEAMLIARLAHPGISQIYDFRKEPDGNLYLVMEYIDGCDLKRVLRAAPLPEHLGLYVISRVCEALHFANTRCDPATGKPLGIVHRDVSPANIMLDREGTVKLIDFGIARHAFRQQDATRTGTLKGKLSYMSPEQIVERETVDARSDVFALGTVLYEIITGQQLFSEFLPDYELMQTIEKVGVDLDDRCEKYQVSRSARKIVSRCLQRDPAARYQSAREVQDDCEQLLHDHTPRAMKEELSHLAGQSPAADTSVPAVTDGQTRTYEYQVPAEVQAAVREQAAGRKKQKSGPLKGAVAAVLTLAMVWGLLELFVGWPGWLPGSGYQLLTIASNPAGALILIDGKEQKKKTPCPVRGLTNGPHALVFKLEGFEAITKKLLVRGKGRFDIDGVAQTGPTVRCAFVVPVMVRSEPEQCAVIVNNERLRSPTPVEIRAAYGTTLDIRLEKKGWPASTLLRFNKDATFSSGGGAWKVAAAGSKIRRYIAMGRLARQVSLSSVPENARVLLGHEVLGVCNTGPLALPCGTHCLTLVKDGFDSTVVSVIIDTAVPAQLGPFYLLRRVALRSLDENGKDARSCVISLDDGAGKKVMHTALPCTLALPGRNVTLVVQGEGGQERKVVVPPTAREYTVAPKSVALSQVTVLLKDENYNALRDVTVQVLKSKTARAEELGSTDHEGRAEGALPPGRYTVKVQEKGYQPLESAIDVLPGNRNQFTFVLYPE